MQNYSITEPPARPAQSQPVYYAPPKVIVTDIEMPFWSMVAFMIKWTFAAIPAMFIVGIVVFVFMALFVAFFGTLGSVGSGVRSLPR